MAELGMMMANEASKQAGNALGQLTNLMLSPINDRRYYNQSKKMMQLQMEGSKEMSEFQRMQQMKMWEDTNFKAQVEQMKKAGLNVGMMYGGSGPGGSVSAQSNNVSGNSPLAGNEMMARMNPLSMAEIENMKAQTRLTNVQADKLAGVDTDKGRQDISESEQRINKLVEETKNEALKGELMILNKSLMNIELNIANSTEDDIIKQVEASADQAISEAMKADAEAFVAQGGKEELIEQLKLSTAIKKAELVLIKATGAKTEQEIANLKMNLDKAAKEIWAMDNKTRQDWMSMQMESKRLWLQERGINFATSVAAQSGQWSAVINDMIAAGKGAGEIAKQLPRRGKIGF